MHNVTIYHNPKCGTSRNVLALIRATGIEPTIIPEAAGYKSTRTAATAARPDAD